MSERAKNMLFAAVGLFALAFMVVGLNSGAESARTAEDRVETLSASIRCPFCNGESLAESPSGVAGDYRELIALRVAAGATDEEIIDEFADNFGDSFILDTSTSPWSVALWVIPVVALLAGAGVVVYLSRRSKDRTELHR
jgi:cytochrome c-type biogenesis protein CcmH